jgi:serine protease Do
MRNNIFRKAGYRALALAAGGAIVISAVAFTQRPQQVKFQAPPVDTRAIDREVVGQNSFSPIVKKVAPAVVSVYTSATARPTAYGGQNPAEEFFRHFFGNPYGPRGMERRAPMPTPRQQGIGSGVITTPDGYILTNNHVVEGADEVKVSLLDGREFTATVVGRDPKTDVAVLKVDAKNLPAVKMADSEKVEVGDLVLALGNPFGIGQTVTTGIVSATGRGGTIGLDYEDFIQTDAAINPGNSGGALVDAEGRLIGLNTAILSRSGGNQGIGFAIPANLARSVMQSIVEDGKVTRGYLGVAIQDVNQVLAEEFDLKETRGALISDVTPDSPAAKAGLKTGDVVMEFNGRKISDSRRLKLEVATVRPGTKVPVKILRGGNVKTVEVTVRELPGSEKLAGTPQHSSEDTGVLNGVAVSDLDQRVRRQFNIPDNMRGAIVSEVEPDSAAAAAGLRMGDVILEINRSPVKSADDAIQMTQDSEKKRTLLRVWRDGGSRYVVVDENKRD